MDMERSEGLMSGDDIIKVIMLLGFFVDGITGKAFSLGSHQ